MRFGILGTGNIAGQFARDAAGALRSTVVAVGSRQQSSAAAFAEAHGLATAHGSYEALLADDAVEAVYISLPNSMHHDWTLAALAAGKHVLCEKPLAVNAAEAEAMLAAAAAADRVLVEAFMYRSHPLTAAVLEQVRGGAIGPVRTLRASFCYRTHTIAGNVRFSTELAGGALMDIGCYCVDFCRLFAGAEPTAVHAVGHLHDTGVDDQTAAVMSFPNGVIAEFVCGMLVQTDNTAIISGEDGYILIPVPWKPPVEQAEFILARGTPPRQDQKAAGATPSAPTAPQTFHFDADRPLYALEADAFAATVRDRAAPAISPDDSLANMRILDQMRRQLGLPF